MFVREEDQIQFKIIDPDDEKDEHQKHEDVDQGRDGEHNSLDNRLKAFGFGS